MSLYKAEKKLHPVKQLQAKEVWNISEVGGKKADYLLAEEEFQKNCSTQA